MIGFDACQTAVRDTTAIAVKGQLFCPSKEPPIEPKEEKASNVLEEKQKHKLHEFIAEWVDEAWRDEDETEADEAEE